MSEHIQGKVKWFQNTKGFGFITRDDGKGDVFVHFTAIHGEEGYKTLQDGDVVEFDVTNSEKGPKAANVRKI